jgi:hypothetical protein
VLWRALHTMPLIDAPVRKAFFWPCVVGVLIAIGCETPSLGVVSPLRSACMPAVRIIISGWARFFLSP